MEQQLLEAFAARTPSRLKPASTRDVPGRGVFAMTGSRRWLAAAAVLVLAVSGWMGYTQWRAGDQDRRAAIVPDAVPVPPDAERGGEALEFITLPTAIGLPAFESGQVVRVEVPLRVMPAYGFDVRAEDLERVVQADVIVGQDGQPRAIRFVSGDSKTDSEPRRRP
jgi:hypothetical protein